ncbi:MAG: hypothetical protein IT560_02740 [Alphaproteobacteria bacterium]|nr:hypothetical protein [Alphaproteobacteria bacterium]
MSASDADDLARRIEAARDSAEVETLFDQLSVLSPAEQMSVVNRVELNIVTDWQRTAPKPHELAQLRMVLDAIEQMKGTPTGDMLRADMESGMTIAEEGQAMSAMFRKILDIKGDAAHSLVKAYVEEERKQPLEDVGTAFGQAKLMVTVEERVQRERAANMPAPNNNPRRPNRGGSFDL